MADLGQTEIAAAEPPPAPSKISAMRNPILDDANHADAAAAGLAQRRRHGRQHQRADRRDDLYRHSRHRAARRDRADVSADHPDDDDVRRRHGRRHGVGDCARARRRRQAARSDAGDPCLRDRHRHRRDVQRPAADLRRATPDMDGRPRRRAHRSAGVLADLFFRRRADLADEHAGGDPARHRQHGAAVGHHVHVGGVPDRAWRHPQPRPVRRAAARHSRHRHRPAQRCRHRRAGDGLVRAERPHRHLAARAAASIFTARCSPKF